MGFPGGASGKETTCHRGDAGLIPGSGRSSEGGHGNPVHYSCLENSRDRGLRWAGYYPNGCKASDTTKETAHVCCCT